MVTNEDQSCCSKADCRKRCAHSIITFGVFQLGLGAALIGYNYQKLNFAYQSPMSEETLFSYDLGFYKSPISVKTCYEQYTSLGLVSINSIQLYSYVGLAVGIMSFILAILGFVLAALKTRALAIIYCVLGLLTFILAVVVGSIQIASYEKFIITDYCYYMFLFWSLIIADTNNFIVSRISGIILIIAAILILISWSGSLVYIS